MTHRLTAICAGVALTLVAGCKKDRTPTPEKPRTSRAVAARVSEQVGESAYRAAAVTPKATNGEDTHQPKILLDPGDPKSLAVNHAVAIMEPTKGHDVRGVLKFEELPSGMRVEADVTGLPPGRHAFHIHVFGDCSSTDGKSAGAHFDLMGSSLHPPKDIKRITGNLGELSAGTDGKAKLVTTIEQASFQGQYSILGRSVIIHEKGNDPKSPPMGAAGGRLACGVIGIRAP